MKKSRTKKLIGIFLACALCLAFIPVITMATGTDRDVANGYYKDGAWVEGSLDQNLPEGIKSVEKTAVKKGINTYDVTLKVVAEQKATVLTNKAATVLVIDTSGSMKDDMRLVNAKKNAKDFINSYAGDVAGSEHYLAIVDFADGTDVDLNWTDVSTAEGKATAIKAIDSLKANGGTNLHAGLKQTNLLFDDAKIKDIGKGHRNTVVLTDGAPTYYIKKCPVPVCLFTHITIDGINYHIKGSGDSGSENTNEKTAEEAALLREKSTIHTICYGARDQKTYKNGPLVSEFLSNSIASDPAHAYNADNANELVKAFEAITETITSGLDGKGLTVTDSAAPFVNVSGLPAYVAQTEDGFTWELKNPVISTEENKTYYAYELTYTVTLDTDNLDFVEGDWYPLNGETYLTLTDGTRVDFPIPAGKGTKTRFMIKYTDGVDDETVFEDQIYDELVYGDKTPEFNGTPEREGYIFGGWTPSVQETVTDTAVYTATWIKQAAVLNAVPVINAENKTLTVGDEFDPLEGVTASDEEDGDITASVKVTKNSVNTAVAGKYEVTYTVTDSQGATVNKTIIVTVNPKMEVLNAVPVINAEDKVLTVGDEFDPLEDVTAVDEEDGDLTDVIDVIENNVDTTAAGTYYVTYTVVDSQGASITKVITVTVKDKEKEDEPAAPVKPDNGNKDNGTDNGKTDNADTTVKTGDASEAMLWTVLEIISAAGIMSILLFKRRRKEQ